MKKKDVIKGVQAILGDTSPSVLAELYFILKNNDGTFLRRIDLDETAQGAISKEFAETVRGELIDDETYSVISISSADDRTNVIYEYDLEEIPSDLNVIDRIIEDEKIPFFNFKKDKLKDIRGIVILFCKDGKNLMLYKQHYPVSLIKKDKGFRLSRLGDKNRFTSLDEDIVRISTSFEFFKLDDTLFIMNINTLEKFFGFHDIIKKKAQLCIKEIEKAGILDNPEVLESMTDTISFSRKMTKIFNFSPVLNKIPMDVIIKFTETHRILGGKFEYNANKDKIKLRTNESKQLFLKLLNDDFLRSELTELYYDSSAKDQLEETSA
ncbi:DUF4868 domain-containing protein [Paenibacillus filicis]|uniref:DUF4868 domain-containing protein n=1 Tax=Paenibacillus gyeongsangnamensis TaxID=3388067 RepID=A0ABT4QL17_9BACL|nr:anti-phage protein KwaB [Paenibacillus filicis]MCZ8517564.1 DUF4868 domain-containing protein [Paenibacillus filicis]